MRACAPDNDGSKVLNQSKCIVDRRVRVSRRHRVADAEQLKSSACVVNSRLWPAGDQIPIVNRTEVC
jgi:hypothetical protein